jgi:SpoIID/LytB domain protein
MRRVRYLLIPVTALTFGVLPAAAEEDGHEVRDDVAAVGDPTPDLVLEGSGWGHGVGMSQEGAYAMARAGHDVDDILERYFTHAELAHAADLGASIDDVPVRVGLASSATNRDVEAAVVDLGATTEEVVWRSCDEGDCRREATQDDGPWHVLADDDGLRIEDRSGDDSEEVFSTEAPELRVGEGFDDPLDVRGIDGDGDVIAHRIVGRGTHEIHDVGDGRLSTVQHVDDLEQYLYGLAEVEAGWPEEALEAQAVLGRTYAATRIGGDAAGLCRCDLGASTSDQLYRGWSKEHEAGGGPWLVAVDDTAGQVLAHDGEMARYPVYSASHGGASENVEDSWAFSSHVPYLRHVEDEWSLHDDNPRRSWTSQVPHDPVLETVADAVDEEVVALESLDIRTTTDGGTPREIDVGARGVDGDLIEATLGEANGTVGGNAIRGALSGHAVDVVDADGEADQRTGLLSAQFTEVGFAPFADDLGGVHEYAAAWAAEAGITQGVADDRFAPTAAVTRRQMAAFLYRTFDIPAPRSQEAFDDVGEREPQREAINALAEAGIAAGFGDGTFRPSERVTRAQMATFLARALGLEQVDPDGRFSDVDEGPHAGAIHALADAAISVGYDDATFRPTLEVSREQMASFLRRAVVVS